MHKRTQKGIKILFGMVVISVFLLTKQTVKAAGVYAFAPDINSDGCVNQSDLTAFGQAKFTPQSQTGDVNDDGKYDMKDVAYVVFASPGCLSGWENGAPQGNQMYQVKSGGLTRSYIVHTPPSYTGQAMPLVINFHGGSGQSTGQEFISRMDASANTNGYIAVYPNGTNLSTSPLDTSFFWNPGQGEQGYVKPLTRLKTIDDVAFVNAMLDKIQSDYSVNTKKVYVTGLSNGGMIAQRLACQLSNRITAMASVESTLWQFTSSCTPSRNIPVLLVHGTSDNWIPYNGGAANCSAVNESNWKSAQEVFDAWKTKNSCDATSTTVTPSADMSCSIASNCGGGAQVGLCAVQNGGHTWPGGTIYIPPSNDPTCTIGNISTANGDQLLWNFFNQFTLP